MAVLLYNKKRENYQIETVWKAEVCNLYGLGYAAFKKNEKLYGVKMELCCDDHFGDTWIFVPTSTQKEANELLKRFFNERQLDLTSVEVKSLHSTYSKAPTVTNEQ